MAAYLIAHVQVTNALQYEEYKRFSSLAMTAHGARVLVRGGAVDILEGDWHPERLVVLEFPGPTQARAFYDSPEYTRARQARADAAIMRMVVVEGV